VRSAARCLGQPFDCRSTFRSIEHATRGRRQKRWYTISPEGSNVRTRTCIGVAITIALLLQARTVVGQPPSTWFGTWKLNVARSTYSPGPPPYRRAMYKIEPWEDGLKVTYEMVYPRGGVSHLEWTGKLDGREYPLQGIEEFVTYAYRPAGDGSYEVIVRLDGRIQATSKVMASSDGRTMTTTTIGTNARGQRVTTTTVYEKQ